MAVRPAEQRAVEAKEARALFDINEKDLSDLSWLSRLNSNSDFHRYLALCKEGLTPSKASIEEVQKRLSSEPMSQVQADVLRQHLLLYTRDIENVERFCGFVAKEVERLRELQDKTQPELQMKLRVLEAQEEKAHA